MVAPAHPPRSAAAAEGKPPAALLAAEDKPPARVVVVVVSVVVVMVVKSNLLPGQAMPWGRPAGSSLQISTVGLWKSDHHVVWTCPARGFSTGGLDLITAVFHTCTAIRLTGVWAHELTPMGSGPWAQVHRPGPMGPGSWAHGPRPLGLGPWGLPPGLPSYLESYLPDLAGERFPYMQS